MIHFFRWHCDGAKRRPSQIDHHTQHLHLRTAHSNRPCYTHRSLITRQNLSIQSMLSMLTFVLHSEVALAAATMRTACVIVAVLVFSRTQERLPNPQSVSHQHTALADPGSPAKKKTKARKSHQIITSSQRRGMSKIGKKDAISRSRTNLNTQEKYHLQKQLEHRQCIRRHSGSKSCDKVFDLPDPDDHVCYGRAS